MKETFIYFLRDPINSFKGYVGKADSPGLRFAKGHLGDTSSCRKANWIKSLKEKGLEPILEIIDQISIKEWRFWESWYIQLFKSWGYQLVNVTQGGEGGATRTGVKQSKQETEKRTNTRRNNGRPWVLQHQKDLAQQRALGNKNMLGRNHSVESREQMSKSHKEIVTSEFCQRMREINLGNQNRKGKLASKEIKQKLSQPIIQLSLDNVLIKEWNSLTQAILETGLKGIANCVSGRTQSAGGFKWEYRNGKGRKTQSRII